MRASSGIIGSFGGGGRGVLRTVPQSRRRAAALQAFRLGLGRPERAAALHLRRERAEEAFGEIGDGAAGTVEPGEDEAALLLCDAAADDDGVDVGVLREVEEDLRWVRRRQRRQPV